MTLLRAILFTAPWLMLLSLYAGWHWSARSCYPAHLKDDLAILAVAMVCGYVMGAFREQLRWEPRVREWRERVNEVLRRHSQNGERAG